MIFVSSSCFKKKKINELLSYCKKNKIKNLEFSGGSEYQKDIFKILTKYSKYFNYSIHNYFPPPKENFIINLGSTNNDIRLKSITFCKKSKSIFLYISFSLNPLGVTSKMAKLE